MSGLPEDSREEDDRQEEQRLRDLRGRVKAARAVVSSTPGLAEILPGDWRKAVTLYARFGVTEEMVRHGVASDTPDARLTDAIWKSTPISEASEHAQAALSSL